MLGNFCSQQHGPTLICLIKTDEHTYVKVGHLPNLYSGTNEVVEMEKKKKRQEMISEIP